MRVAAGAVARKVIPGVTIRGALVQIGRAQDRPRRAGIGTRSDNNPFFSPDPGIVETWSNYLDEVRKAGSSVGAVIEVVAEGVPAGWGAPIYGKLDQDLAGAMMSINAVKGVEIGAGMAAAELTGEDNADEIRMGNDGKPLFLSNNAGGILGGISTGQPIVVPLRGQADLVDPHAPAHHRPVRQRDRDLHQGPPRSLRRHPRRAGRRGHDGDRAGRPLPAPPRAGRVGGVTRWPRRQRLAAARRSRPTAIAPTRPCRRSPTTRRCVVFDGVCVLCSAVRPGSS